MITKVTLHYEDGSSITMLPTMFVHKELANNDPPEIEPRMKWREHLLTWVTNMEECK